MRARLFIAATAWACACGVTISDYRGRACDASHPCVDGWVCAGGTCTSPGDGGTDGSVPDSGVKWRQWVDGFVSTLFAPASCCELDAGSAADGNTVTTQNAIGGTGVARGAFQLDPAQGQLRGHIRISAGPPAPQHLVVVQDTSGQAFLSLYLSPGGTLGVSSAAGTLQTGDATDAQAIPSFAAGADYLVDVTWQRGAFRDVAVNGTQLIARNLTGTPATPTLSEISLGLTTEDGGTSPDLSVALWRWQIADDPSATLSE